MKVADDGSVKVDVVKVADDAWHEARPLGTTAWHVRNDIDNNFDFARKLVLHATEPRCYLIDSCKGCARKGFSRLRHRSHSHSHSLPQQRKASPHTAHDTRPVTSPHSGHTSTASARPAARGLRSGPDHFASCLAFSYVMRFTLSRLSLSTARAARYQLSHAHSRWHAPRRLVLDSCTVAVQLHTLYAFVSRHYSGISNVCTHFMFVSHHYSYLKCTC